MTSIQKREVAETSEVAVVIGGAGEIGSAITARLAHDGYVVACVDSDLDRARAVVASLDAGVAFRCDVRKPSQVRRLYENVDRTLGGADVLINVAGVFFTHRVTELTEAEWDLVIDVNLKGTFLTCQAFLPAMIALGRGRIVNVASTSGIKGGRDRAAYSASKGGVVLFTRSLALDHGPDGVRINCVCPGLIDTTMADWLRDDELARRNWERSIPAQRLGTVSDVAAAVAYLVSPEADYIHGAALVIDGGYTAG